MIAINGSGIKAGADDFISKPFDRVELRARIRTITRLNRYRRLILERVRLLWVVDQAKDAYIQLDIEDHIIYSNAAARDLLKLPNLDGSITFLECVQNGYLCEPVELWKQWRTLQEVATPLFLICPETASSQPLWFTVELLDLPLGEKTNRMVRIRDITEHVEHQRVVRSFQHMIAHKLLTPLSNIMMAFELMRREAKAGKYAEVESLSWKALNSGQQLKKEVDLILHHINSRVLYQGGSACSIQALSGLLMLTGQILGKDHLQLFVAETVNREGLLSLSASAVEMIIQEIYENAVKFHPQRDPTLEVVVEQNTPEAILLSVQDDGIHLSPEQLENVWIPYYQAEKEFTGQVPGMGLGLPTIAMLLWEVGGQCRMRNCPDHEGVIVELMIPLRKELDVDDVLYRRIDMQDVH